MASAIQTLIQRYRPEVQNHHIHTLISNEAAMNLLRLDKLGQTFMDLLTLSLYDQQLLLATSREFMQNYASGLLMTASKDKNVEFGILKKIIGKFILEAFTTPSIFSDLREDFLSIYRQSSPANLSLSNPYSESCTNSSIEYNQSQHSFAQERQQKVEDRLHVEKVMSYLMEISAPQTELSYLCQSMGWQFRFRDELAYDGEFEAIAEVKLEYNSLKQQLTEGFVAKQKQTAKALASFKMLRRIYLSIPQIWEIYSEIRAKKGLLVANGPNCNLKDIYNHISQEKIQVISIIHEREAVLCAKQSYLKQITSFKAELNELRQQNPGIFTWYIEKEKLANNRWRLKGQMRVLFEGLENWFEQIQEDVNTKTAQEGLAKRIIEKVYGTYMDIFQRMASIKDKKAIRT